LKTLMTSRARAHSSGRSKSRWKSSVPGPGANQMRSGTGGSDAAGVVARSPQRTAVASHAPIRTNDTIIIDDLSAGSR
jgi:hypothetical protein